MTQQIEPLKLQHKTNIEEHMQFFTKINEIVGAYKATVDLVDSLTPEIRNLLTALEGYRAEILNLKDFRDFASGSIATLNETVDLLEGKIGQCVKTVGQSSQQIEGSLHLNDGDFTADNVTALETIDADTLQAHALNVIDAAVVPDTANGSISQYAVNAKRLMTEPSLVRTDGNQDLAGTKTFTSKPKSSALGDNIFPYTLLTMYDLNRLLGVGGMCVMPSQYENATNVSINTSSRYKLICVGGFTGATFSNPIVDGQLNLVGEYGFQNTKGIKEVIQEYSDEEIVDWQYRAFYNCSMEKLTLKGKVFQCGNAVFQNCKNLKSVVIPNATIVPDFNNSFEGSKMTTSEGTLYVPTKMLQYYKASSYWSTLGCQIKDMSEMVE